MARKLFITLWVLLLLAVPAVAQSGCGGQFGANKVCGNATGSTGLPGPVSITPGMFGAIAGGTVVGNPTTSNAVPVATAAPVLGIPGTSTGQVGLAGSSSGTAILRAQTAAGSAVSLLPTVGGTLVGTAVSPLAIDATTGEASITGLAGAVLSGSPPAFSRAPVLGVPGTAIGTLGFGGNTSGTVTITPQATAGSPILTLPNTSGTFAVGASLPLVLSATTGNLTCPTCATSTLNGAALTKVDDTNVTLTLGGSPTTALLNATSITAGWAGQLSLARGGTNANLTASNGGIFYSTASAAAILSGTGTVRLPLVSGAAGAPSWGAFQLPASVTSGGIPYFSSTSSMASSALLARSGVVVGGGAGGSPATIPVGTNGQVLVGSTGVNPLFATLSQDCTITNAGVITCTRSNNVPFGTAAFVNTGTSGATVSLLNGNNTWSGTNAFNNLVSQTTTITPGSATTVVGYDSFVTRGSGSFGGDSVYGNRTYYTDNGTNGPLSTIGYDINMQYNSAANTSAINYAMRASGLAFASITAYSGITTGLYVDTGKTVGTYNGFYAAAPNGAGTVTTKRAFLSDAGAGPIIQNDATAATALSTGALQVAGGAAVTLDSFVGGRLFSAFSSAPPAGGAATVGVRISSTASLGIFVGSGAPTFSAAQGSIYLRTDGSSTSTRLYVNTNGSTGWTNFTSAT